MSALPRRQPAAGLTEADAQDTGFLAALGRQVRESRERRGLARKAVSQSAGVSERYLAQLEAGEGNASVLLLRSIANASGGQFLTLEQLNTLPARIDTIRQRQSRLVEYPLWDSPYLFVFVLACLSTEWALRKKFGLA